MNSLIFGYSWEEIQAMQNKQYRPETVSGKPNKQKANSQDAELLRTHGEKGLIDKGFYGVIDRLKNSGMM